MDKITRPPNNGEGSPPPPKDVVKTRPPPEMVKIGGREIISSGHWNDWLIAKYVMENGIYNWLDVGDLARRAWGQNSALMRAKARRNLPRLWTHIFLKYNRFMVTLYNGPHGRATAVKMYNHASNADFQAAIAKLDKMERRAELSNELLERALTMLEGRAEEGHDEPTKKD